RREAHRQYPTRALVKLFHDAFLVEEVRETATDVDIGEEVGRDATAIELTATDVLVVRGVDVEVEEHGRDRGRGPVRVFVDRHARRAAKLDQRGALVQLDAIRVTLLESEDARRLLVDVLVDDVLYGRSATPVVLERFGDDRVIGPLD